MLHISLMTIVGNQKSIGMVLLHFQCNAAESPLFHYHGLFTIHAIRTTSIEHENGMRELLRTSLNPDHARRGAFLPRPPQGRAPSFRPVGGDGHLTAQ
jgi:hypothetical protein